MNSFRKGFKLLIVSFILLTSAGLLITCNQMGKQSTEETPTRGKIRIFADESYKPIIDSEVYTFTNLYRYASITPQYKPEVDIINDFMNDSIKVIVTNKKLTDDQIQYLRDTLVVARTTTIAYDALAFIVNKANKDTLLTYNTIKDIFFGRIDTWKEINNKSNLDKINVVFDNTKSGNIRYFKEKFEITEKLQSNFYAVNSNEEVIDFISKNPSALGIISVNWISNKHNPEARDFISRIKVVAVSSSFDNTSYYLPVQGSIYNKTYPFTREVYLISRETFAGLGSGFISWVASEPGQRIILKSGLVPATMPIRLIQVKH